MDHGDESEAPGGARRPADRVAHTLEVVRSIAAEYAEDSGRSDVVIRRVEDLYDERTGLPK